MMTNSLLDFQLAMHVAKVFLEPFTSTDAYKMGIIDRSGAQLRTAASLVQSKEQEAFSMLNRVLFKIKRIALSYPNADLQINRLMQAFVLRRESTEQDIERFLSESDETIYQMMCEEGVASGITTGSNVGNIGGGMYIQKPFKKKETTFGGEMFRRAMAKVKATNKKS